jgi:hypothetical protein
MPRILCTLPTASTLINGIVFVSHRLGMLSEDVPEAIAKRFATIKGYEIYDPDAPRPGTDPVAVAIMDAAKQKAAHALLRTGPVEPNNDMVICPTCTSQFRAVPVNVQNQVRTLMTTAKNGKIRPGAAPPAAKTEDPGATAEDAGAAQDSTSESQTKPPASDPQF